MMFRSLLAVFTALPLWTTVELSVWVFYVFKRYTGLYFWAVLITTWGVSIHAIGFILKFCVPSCNWIASTILAEIGWVSMVTGFSVVLYSRLNLVVRPPFVRKSGLILKLVLAMIITDAFLFHVPTIVFQFGVSNKASHKKYLPYMAPMERVQIVGFSVQEIIISAIYVYATMSMLKSGFSGKIKSTMAFLIIIQILVVLCDVVVIALDYAEYFTLKAVIHSFVYAVKLQLEFVILNKFRKVSKRGLAPRGLDAIAFSSGDSSTHHPPGTLTPPSPPTKPEGKKWWNFSVSSTRRSDSTSDIERNLSVGTLTPEQMAHNSMTALPQMRRGSKPLMQTGMPTPNPSDNLYLPEMLTGPRAQEHTGDESYDQYLRRHS
jgi:hypothetical protein